MLGPQPWPRPRGPFRLKYCFAIPWWFLPVAAPTGEAQGNPPHASYVRTSGPCERTAPLFLRCVSRFLFSVCLLLLRSLFRFVPCVASRFSSLLLYRFADFGFIIDTLQRLASSLEPQKSVSLHPCPGSRPPKFCSSSAVPEGSLARNSRDGFPGF